MALLRPMMQLARADLRRIAPRTAILIVVLLLHLLVILALLFTRGPLASEEGERSPFVVKLFPLPEAPAPDREAAQKPAEEPATAPNPSRQPQPQPLPQPVPTSAPAPPLPAAPPSAVATGPIVAGESDPVFDLDHGGGGGSGTAPRWVRKVSNDEFFTLMDPVLLRAPLEVELQMLCTLSLDGRAKCQVLREVPFYPGLRRAVLQAVPMIRIAPGKRDGRAIDQQRVSFIWRVTIDRPSGLGP